MNQHISFLTYLKEVFDNPLQYVEVKSTATLQQYAFKYNDEVFSVVFDIHDVESLKLVIVSFALIEQTNNLNYSLISSKKSAIPVMSTVIRIIKQFINHNEFDYLVCTAANEGSRVGVYAHMVQKLVSSKSFYHIKTKDDKTIFVVSTLTMTSEIRDMIDNEIDFFDK